MRILIVGAGIGGLCLAIGLAPLDLELEVIEQASDFQEIGAGLIIWANGAAALQQLGLLEEIATIAQDGLGASIRDAKGKELSAFDPDQLRDRLGYPNLSVHRADFQAMLADTLEKRRPGALRQGVQCRQVEVEDTRCLAYLVSADGTESQVTANVVVGCDGLRSTVRSAVIDSSAPRFAGYVAWRGVTGTGLATPGMWGGESWGCGARFGFAPLTSGRIYWYATANASSPGQFGAVDDWRPQLLTRFAGWHSPVQSLIEGTPASHIHFELRLPPPADPALDQEHGRTSRQRGPSNDARPGSRCVPGDRGRGRARGLRGQIRLSGRCADRAVLAFLRANSLEAGNAYSSHRAASWPSRPTKQPLRVPYAKHDHDVDAPLRPSEFCRARIAAARKLDEQLRALDSLSKK